MRCDFCNSELAVGEVVCGNCGRNVVKNREDLQRVDPKSTAAIGFSLAGIGALAALFVSANLNVPGFSPIDYLVPVVLLVMGTGTVIYSRTLKK